MAEPIDGKDNGREAGTVAERVIEAAMALAAERNWEQVSLLDIAQAAGVSLADLYRRYRSKQNVLAAFSRRIDEEVLAEEDVEDLDEPARDRLFDVLMRRFDHLLPYRAGIDSILRAYRRDPVMALGGLRQLRRSMACMLEAANLSSSGLRGELRLNGLCAIYVATLRTWLTDETADMAKTMAALDGYLRRIERPVAMAEGAWGRGRERAAEEGSA